MICLTGDVHHWSLQHNDQKYIADPGVTEIQVAQRYVTLLEKYGVKITFYTTGKCFTEEWENLKPIAMHPLVEIGGHGHRARQPRPLFDWYGRWTGNWNGPRWYQDWDIRTNQRVSEERIGKRFVAWRAHSYKVDPNTYPLLAKHGVRLVSDEVCADVPWPEKISNGLISHPMNVMPDHEHIYHSHRTKAYVEHAKKTGYGTDAFGSDSYPIDEWGRLVLGQVEAIENRGGITTILAHPLCMYNSDRFKTLEMLLEYFATTKTLFAREIPDLIDNPPAGLLKAREKGEPS